MKKTQLIVMLCAIVIIVQWLVACSSRPTPVAYIPHLVQSPQNKQEIVSDSSVNQVNVNAVPQQSAEQRKSVYFESCRELNEYTGFIFQELLIPVSNAFWENNYIVTADKEKADLLAVLDFGVEGKKKITKMICMPHYEEYPVYSSLYGGFGSGYGGDIFGMRGELVRTGTDCYPKEYYVFPHILKVSCYRNRAEGVDMGQPQFEVELIYQSLQNDYRSSMQVLTSRFSRQLREVILWNNSVHIEFDFFDNRS